MRESRIIEKNGELLRVTLEVTKYEDSISAVDIKKIKAAINRVSDAVYKHIKSHSGRWYGEFLDANSSAPKYNSLDIDSSDVPMIMLKFAKGTNQDHILFYQDMVAKTIKKDSSVSEYKFWTEDYPGIFVEKK